MVGVASVPAVRDNRNRQDAQDTRNERSFDEDGHRRLTEAIAALRTSLDSGLKPDADIGALVHDILAYVTTAPDVSYEPAEPGALEALLERRLVVDTDKVPLAHPTGFELSAHSGERARLLLPNIFGEPRAVLHLLISARPSATIDSPVALRWVRGNEPEETIVQFARESWILNGQMTFPVQSQLYLLSFAYGDGLLRIFVDGVLVLCRESRREGPPDGFCLDVIGTTAVPARVVVHGLAAESPSSLPGTLDALNAPTAAVAEAIQGDSIPRMASLLYGLAAAPLALDQAEVETALDNLAGRTSAYPQHVVHALVDRLPPARQGSARAKIDSKEPQPVIRCESVTCEISSNPAAQGSFTRLLRPRVKTKIRILHDINLSIFAGDIVGVIGRNGAGKSTLLRCFIGAMPISSGSIGIRGRPTLLRPGGGMQPELTGLQNIMKAGLYMGLSPTMIRKVAQDVIDFSELGEHIDRPFRYYSDGMRSRLIFALATCIPHDILMLDELLSAGDFSFQRKAMQRLEEFIAQANTVIVVQHTFDFILSKCTKCLYLKDGRQEFFGDPSTAIELYKGDL